VPNTFTSIEEIRARAAELDEAIERQATAYPGRMPEDEQSLYDADVAERRELRADIAAWEKRQADLVDRASKSANVETPDKPFEGRNQIVKRDVFSMESRATTLEGRRKEFHDDARRINEITRYNPLIADQDKTKQKVEDILEQEARDDKREQELAIRMKVTGTPLYLRAFEKIVKSRGQAYLTPEEQRGTALAVGVDGTGGFAVPFAFDPTIIAIGSWSGAVNPYRRVCRVVTISGTDTWNALTSTAVVATRTTEAAASVEQGPTLAQPQYIVTRVQGQITSSYELLQDRTDLVPEMSKLIQEAKDNEEESSMATGATAAANIGVGPVNGTSGAYTASGQTISASAIAAGDADAVDAALPVRHRFNAQWFMNRVNIRKFQAVETAGGRLFGGNQYQAVGNINPERTGNTGLKLLGYPVNESPSLPTATTANIVIGTLLNPDTYVIVDRIGMSIQFIPFLFNSSALVTGQAAIYFLYRNTAKPLNVDGGRTLRFQ
jgi:HK97 family phage major capsid protein